MANHPNRGRIDDSRILAHIEAEHKARVGYPYEKRAEEAAWVAANLPASKKDFDRIAKAVGGDALSTAALLLGTVTMFQTTGERVLAKHGRPDLVAAWGLNAPPPRKTKHVCKVCPRPAAYQANRGWACADHYDALS